MELFKTNACLGYGQYAILVKVSKNTYMVIDNNSIPVEKKEDYEIGSICELEDFYVENTDIKVEETEGYKIAKKYEHLSRFAFFSEITK